MQAASMPIQSALPPGTMENRTENGGPAVRERDSDLAPRFAAILGNILRDKLGEKTSNHTEPAGAAKSVQPGKIRIAGFREGNAKPGKSAGRFGAEKPGAVGPRTRMNGSGQTEGSDGPSSRPGKDSGEPSAASAGKRTLPAAPTAASEEPVRADPGVAARRKPKEAAPQPGAARYDSLVAAAGSEVKPPRAEGPAEDVDGKSRDVRIPARKDGKRGPKLTVLDLRMKAEASGNEPSRDSGSPESPSPGFREGVRLDGRSAEGAASAPRDPGGLQDAGIPFSEVLSRHLDARGSQEIVKAAHIVLRDGDSGMIRLRLEPESLGNVKIELKMTEKNITGRIVVETEEARNAFERSLAGLRDAFSAEGFESARLEVSVGGGEADGRETAEGDAGGPFFSERLKELDAAVPGVPAVKRAEQGVNILA